MPPPSPPALGVTDAVPTAALPVGASLCSDDKLGSAEKEAASGVAEKVGACAALEQAEDVEEGVAAVPGEKDGGAEERAEGVAGTEKSAVAEEKGEGVSPVPQLRVGSIGDPVGPPLPVA